ncbi:hypothetical protein ACIG5E_04220 [Kitasatospora sp. NPDC053057]|uniref:hypothetical protein n=1 Tax=Kitasatospora sp. NPDC053057 TaxID=3364062 RepID=UPI0037C5A804
MTDKIPRPRGGDDDGSAGTPTERLLREAMNARTSLITAHDLRPAAPPRSRVRRLRPMYAVSVPVLGLAAAAAIGVVTLHSTPVAKQDVPPPPAAGLSASPGPTPTPTPSATASATPTDDARTQQPLADSTPTSTQSATGAPTGPATPYTFRGVKFKLPAGWRVAPADPADYHLCALSPGAPQGASAQNCQPYGVDLAVFDTESSGWPSTADLDAQSGWGHQPNCPIWGDPHPPAAGESVSSAGPTKSTPTVSGRPALKSQWQVTCGQTPFTAQVWALPKDQVFVSAVGLKDDYQAGLQSIVNSLDVSGHQAAPSTAPGQSDITVSVDGLAAGQQLRVGSAVVTFSVTFRNTGQSTSGQLEPLVFTDRYAGTPTAPGQQLPNDGRLELQTDSGWIPKPMSPGADTSYATARDEELFSLAPGQSRKLTYRLTMGPKSGPGDMPLRAQAVLPYRGGDLTVLGRQDVTVKLVW